MPPEFSLVLVSTEPTIGITDIRHLKGKPRHLILQRSPWYESSGKRANVSSCAPQIVQEKGATRNMFIEHINCISKYVGSHSELDYFWGNGQKRP